MIKAADVQRYHDLCALIKESEKALKELKIERDDREAKIITAARAKQRVESTCSFRVLVENAEKTYSPPYKRCAIELTSEAKVNAWVKKNNPHEKEDRLKLVPKKFGQAKLPAKFAEADRPFFRAFYKDDDFTDILEQRVEVIDCEEIRPGVWQPIGEQRCSD